MNNLPKTGNIRKCVAWDPNRVVGTMPVPPNGRIDQRIDKSYNVQVYVDLAVGAARAEDVGVIEIDVDESFLSIDEA
jgi:hypothetical protein